MYVLIGDGPDRRELLEEPLDGITHLPSVPNRDMADLFRSADAYISCSPTDGTSISMMEAMSVGLPILVPDNSSNREWVTPGVNGWLFPAGNSEALAATLESVRPSAGMQKANIEVIQRRGNWAENSKVLKGIYAGLLGDAPWPPSEPLVAGL